MSNKLLLFALLAVVVLAQNPGSRIHLTTNFLNNAKNWALPRFMPGNRVDFHIPDEHIMGVKCYNMDGYIEIPNDSLYFQVSENVLQIFINNIHVSMGAKLNLKVAKAHISPSAHCSFNSQISLGVNGAGQLQVTYMSVNDFRIPDTSAHMPGVFKKIVNHFIHMINDKVQNKINSMMPEMQGKINEILSTTPIDVPFGNLPVSIDSTFSSAIQFTNNQMIIANNLFAWNNQKPKTRPPFNNDVPFPFEGINTDFTLYLSEYTLNSISYAAYDAGMMNESLDFNEIQSAVNVETLKSVFNGLDEYLNQNAGIQTSVHANTFPTFNIANGVFGLSADFTADVQAIINGQAIQLLSIRIAANLGVSAQVINENALYVQLVNAALSNFSITVSNFKSIDSEGLTNIINALLAYYLPRLNAKFFNGAIPINGPNFVLQNAGVEFVDHHIKIQATPVFV